MEVKVSLISFIFLTFVNDFEVVLSYYRVGKVA